MKKEIRNGVILLSIGIIASIGIILSKTNFLTSVYLLVSDVSSTKSELKYNSENVPYNNEKTKIKANNIKDALDEINAKVEGKSYIVQNKINFSTENESKENNNVNDNNSNESEKENNNLNQTYSNTTENNNLKEEIKGELNEIVLSEEEKRKYEEKFLDVETIQILELNVSEENKGKDITYKVKMIDGYEEGDRVIVYGNIDGEEEIISSKIENGEIVFTTNKEGKIAIILKKVKKDIDIKKDETQTTKNIVQTKERKKGKIIIPIVLIGVIVITSIIVLKRRKR